MIMIVKTPGSQVGSPAAAEEGGEVRGVGREESGEKRECEAPAESFEFVKSVLNVMEKYTQRLVHISSNLQLKATERVREREEVGRSESNRERARERECGSDRERERERGWGGRERARERETECESERERACAHARENERQRGQERARACT